MIYSIIIIIIIDCWAIDYLGIQNMVRFSNSSDRKANALKWPRPWSSRVNPGFCSLNLLVLFIMALLPKAIPAPVLGKLIPPDPTRIYFENCLDLPFDSESPAFSVSNAWWLAEASFLAYQNPGQTLDVAQLNAAGYQLQFVTTPSSQAVVIDGRREIIVAFRGTHFEGLGDPWGIIRLQGVNFQDFVNDIDFATAEIEPGRNVHRGSKRAFDSIWPAVSAEIESLQRARLRPLWFTGHSLGAALATIAADRCGSFKGLYTFGSPKMVAPNFIAGFQVSNVFRVIHCEDVAPSLPPGDCYVHVGQPKHVHHRNGITDAPALKTWGQRINAGLSFGLRAFDCIKKKPLDLLHPTRWPLPIDALADHAPIYYANRLWNAILNS